MSEAAAPGSSLEALRKALREAREALRGAYLKGKTPNWLLRAHARLIDRILQDLWRSHAPSRRMALVATGGYGRGELYPHSDVDMLVLLPRPADAALERRLEQFIGDTERHCSDERAPQITDAAKHDDEKTINDVALSQVRRDVVDLAQRYPR